jgi:hypothetical protein
VMAVTKLVGIFQNGRRSDPQFHHRCSLPFNLVVATRSDPALSYPQLTAYQLPWPHVRYCL